MERAKADFVVSACSANSIIWVSVFGVIRIGSIFSFLVISFVLFYKCIQIIMNNQNKNGIIFLILLHYAKGRINDCSFAQFWGVMHQKDNPGAENSGKAQLTKPTNHERNLTRVV